MTPPDAPTAMTLEEATVLHGLTFVRNLDDSAWVAGRIRFLSPHDHGKYAHAWEPLGVGATWPEAASQALGRPVVPRDPTAELVEALYEALEKTEPFLEYLAQDGHEGALDLLEHVMYTLVKSSAALAKWKAQN